MNGAADREHVPRPPLVYLAGILAGAAADWFAPVRLLPVGVQVWVGGPILVLALVLVLMAAWELRRAGTSPLHERATTAVVAHGLYSYSRNPIYAAMTLGCVGLAILVDRVWILAGTVPAVLVIDRVVIAREEAFLEARFGAMYSAYKESVRRWI